MQRSACDTTGSRVAAAWLDGAQVEETGHHVDLMAHTLHYGLGVFEGIRCYRLADGGLGIFRLQDHVQRLFASARFCQIAVPATPAVVGDACIEVARRAGQPVYLRPLVFLGDGGLSLDTRRLPVHVYVAAVEFATYLGEEGLRHGVRALVSARRRAEDPALAHAKIVGQYSTMVLAKLEALQQGSEEAIFLDQQGFVSEATSENIFAVRDDVLWTAPATAAILAGITRDTVLHIARDLQLQVREEPFTADSLATAAEVFLTSTAAEVTPVREVNGRPVGTGEPGPVTRAIQERYFSIVNGRASRSADWITAV